MNDDKLRLTLVQDELIWQDAAANRRHFEQLLAPLAGSTDLVVLPEMFTTGFTMAPERVAEAEQGASLAWMREQARRLDAAVCGSIAVRSARGFCNRLYWVDPQGGVSYYDKRHLFRMGGEHEHYQSGSERPSLEYRGWRIRPIVCYDLRFPVWCRNDDNYDLLLCVANWPAARRQPWRLLLQARAVENLCYVAGVNRVGRDGMGLDYSGDSLLVDFKGQLLVDGADAAPMLATAELERSALQAFRQRFPAWQDADSFRLEP